MPLIEHAEETITVDAFRKGQASRDAFVKLTIHGRSSQSIRLPLAKLAEFIDACIEAKWAIEEGG